MVIAPGIQVSEIWDAAVKCREIYEAFRDKDKNAASELVSFQNELIRVQRSFEFQEALYDKTKRRYPGAEDFQSLLRRCFEFIDQHESLVKQYYGRQSPRGWYQTIASRFSTAIPTFRQALAHNRQEFLNWKVDLLLELALNRAEQPVAASSRSSTIAPAVDPDTEELRNEISALVSVIYAHGRLTKSGNLPLTSSSTLSGLDIPHDEVTALRLNARFWTIIGSICRHGRISEDYRPPSIALEDLSRHLVTGKQQSAIEGLSGTVRYPREQPMIFPRQVRLRIYLRQGNGVEQHREATSYIFLGRRFIYHGMNKGRGTPHQPTESPFVHAEPIVEHRLSQGCFPNTPHRIHGQHQSVTFLEGQDISILGPGESVLRASVRFFFYNGEDYFQFQSDLRGKVLHQEFHVMSITSANSHAGHDADNVCVKLWNNSNRPEQATLSSPAEFQDRRTIFEWALQWFDFPEARHGATARLRFTTPPNSGSSSLSRSRSRHRSKRGRRALSSRFRRSHSGSTIDVISSAASSIHSTDGSQLRHAYAPSAWLDSVRYLDFKFDNDHERDEFVDAVGAALQSFFTSPSLASESLPPSSELRGLELAASELALSELPSPELRGAELPA